MAKHEDKAMALLKNGEPVPASFPVVVSASRRTDIPAFYSEWFFDRLKKGWSCWINPFNNSRRRVFYEKTKFIVFWSKNPAPLLKRLDYLKERGIGCCVQFTLNDYEAEGLEPGVPPLAERIETFRLLAARLGKGAIIWRFDPLVAAGALDIGALLSKIQNIGARVHDCAEKLVFSFADLSYKKARIRLARKLPGVRDWQTSEKEEFARGLKELIQRQGWNLRLAACGESINLNGVERAKCVDDQLILRLCHDSPELLEFFGAGKQADSRKALKNSKDKGQRKECGCAKSLDIGLYNSCPHLCLYCYANHGEESVKRNYEYYKTHGDFYQFAELNSELD